MLAAITLLLFLFFKESKAAQFYLEGYANLNLSYGNGVQGALSTDTNRFSDGITSAASFDSTSPQFVEYVLALANTSDRVSRFTEYMASAAEQGVAGYGDGDKVREDAKLKILTQPNYKNLTAPEKNFTVFAGIKWNPSDFAIQEGETYRISVLGIQTGFGSQYWTDGGIRVNAEGYTSFFDAVSNCYVALGSCRSYLKKKRRLLEANWMSLSCAIGQFVRNVNAIEEGNEAATNWVPLDESILQQTVFNVGQSVEIRAEHSGQLVCFANDAHTLYWNNGGSLEVTATRVSWPPSGDIYYLPLADPACDSAYAVYANYGKDCDMYGEGVACTKCNPAGGGSGWVKANVDATTVDFGTQTP